MDSSRYWGVFISHDYDKIPEWDVMNNYTGNSMVNIAQEDELRLLSRTNHLDSIWIHNDTVLPDVGNNTITMVGQTKGEYILG